MQGTAEFHDQIADAVLPQAEPIFDDATTLDTALHMLNPEPTLVERLIGPLLLPCQILAPWLLRGHADLDLGQCERQEAHRAKQSLGEEEARRRVNPLIGTLWVTNPPR